MKNLLKSFGYAFKGITYCIAHERNMRIHLCFMAYMFGFLTVHDFFEVSRTQFALLFAVCGLVLALEAVNTAIEKAVDLATEKQNPLAKISKDTAAGAVLVSAIFSVIIGVVILFQPDAFIAMAEYYRERIYLLVILALSLVLSFAFIIKGIPSRR